MTADAEQPSHGEGLARITSSLVSLHKEFYGRGPVKAKSFLVNDTVICVLEGGFTIVERTSSTPERRPPYTTSGAASRT